MFQTEPIHFLQSFAGDGLTALMVGVSAMGYAPFYIGVLSLVTFGISFRKGFLLIQMVLWVSLLTDLAKNAFALPRPSDVDVNVKLPGKDYPNPSPLAGMGARSFFGLPHPEAIELYRAQPDWSYGFPSGHVSATTTLWGGASLLFRYRAVWMVGLVIVLLMPLSRIYLGRHFLADVIGGLLLGGLAIACVYPLWIRPGAPLRLPSAARLSLGANARTILLSAGLVLLPPALFALFPQVHPERAGALLGLNVAFLVVGRSGFPEDEANLLRRGGRVLLALLLYGIAALAVHGATGIGGIDADSPWIAFFTAAVPPFVMLWGTVRLGLKTSLYGAFPP